MKTKKEKPKKEIIYVEDRGYYIGNGKIDNWNEVVDNVKSSKNRFYRKSAKFWTGFKKFIAKGSVVDIAVALAISAAFNVLVNSIITAFINPLIGVLFNTHSLEDLKYVITPAVEANVELGIEASPEVAILYGLFLDALIKFLVISLTLYIFIRVFIKLKEALHFNELEERIKLMDEEEVKKRQEAKEEEEKAKAEAERKELERQELLNNIATQTAILSNIEGLLQSSKNTQQYN